MLHRCHCEARPTSGQTMPMTQTESITPTSGGTAWIQAVAARLPSGHLTCSQLGKSIMKEITYWQWWFSIGMLDYRRVFILCDHKSVFRLHGFALTPHGGFASLWRSSSWVSVCWAKVCMFRLKPFLLTKLDLLWALNCKQLFSEAGIIIVNRISIYFNYSSVYHQHIIIINLVSASTTSLSLPTTILHDDQ